HGDVLMWLMKTLLTSRCINQRGAGHVGLNCSLVELDNFLRSILFGSNNTFSKRISNSLTIQQKRIIAKLNFKSGFYMIRFHTFSYSRLKEIKGCWK
ncbi:hypothetical protein ACRE6W_23080, partial [Klebsiella pneumoniae]